MIEDLRRFSPSTARNRVAIDQVLRRYLPRRGFVLEIASGSGEHITHFASHGHAELSFQPSDRDPLARASIDAWTQHLSLSNVRPAIMLDVATDIWPIVRADAVLNINMIHIAPWSAAADLMRGAAATLPSSGLLYLYGPFRQGDQHTASSNAVFDQDLRSQNPAWGIRDLEAVTALAVAAGFAAPIIEEMPANNLSLIFHRQPQ